MPGDGEQQILNQHVKHLHTRRRGKTEALSEGQDRSDTFESAAGVEVLSLVDGGDGKAA